MSLDRKSESGRIIKEGVIQKEHCREAMRSLGDAENEPEDFEPIRAGATKKLRDDDQSHSISMAAHERGLVSNVKDGLTEEQIER